MPRILRWLGIAVLGLLALLVVTYLALLGIANSRLTRTYNVTPESVTIPRDAAAVERGKTIALGRAGCADCHKPDLGGGVFIDEPILGRVETPNLTSGKGGVAARYTDADWVRTLRHGVKPDGRPVFIMPSEEFYPLSDQDLGDLIAYVKTVPAVDRETHGVTFGPLGPALFVAGQLGPLPADVIDHTAPRASAPARGVTVEYGKYLASTSGCMGCHGRSLSGAPNQTGNGPDSPAIAPNLTPGGELKAWSETDFVKALKTGVTPSGRQLSTDMPWKSFALLPDDDLRALYQYVHSVPAKEYNQP